MEGVGAEVSLKIRSAIKAKLMELGAYVDDELPDYIMVMVANKRSKQQMENDLELFLTDNTSTFTAWLHQVLSKLQEVTVSLDRKPSSDSDKKKKAVLLEDQKEREKKKKAKKEKDKEYEKSQPTSKLKDPDPDNHNMDFSADVNINGLKRSKSQSDSETKPIAPSSAQEGTASKVACQTDEDDDDFINLKADAEADLWEGEADETTPSSSMKDKESVKTASRRASVSYKMDFSEHGTKSTERVKTGKSESSEWERSPTPPVLASPPTPASGRPQTTSRIIKISEVLREEEEAINSSVKRNLDDRRITKKPESSESNKKLKPSPVPITFDVEDTKEDDEGVFGKHIAHELRQLSPSQRSLAKLRIQQVLFECQQSSAVPVTLKSTISEVPSTQHQRQKRRDPRRPVRLDRQRKRSPIRPPNRSTLRRPLDRKALDRKPSDRKRSPIRFGVMRMDSPKYNPPKKLSEYTFQAAP